MATGWPPQDEPTYQKVMVAVTRTSKAKSPITNLFQDIGDGINIGDMFYPADVKYSAKHAGIVASQGFLHCSC